LFPALNEVNLQPRRLPQMERVEAVEIGLLGRAVLERDLGAQRGNPPDDSSCDVGFGNGRIKHPARIDRGNDALELYPLAANFNLGHLRNQSAERIGERQTACVSGRQGLTPSGLLASQIEHLQGAIVAAQKLS